MNKHFHKMRAIPVLIVLALVMLSVMPVTAAENLTVSVSAEEIRLPEDGNFSFSVTLSADFPFLGSDIGVRCSEGVSLTAVSADNSAATVLPLTPGQTEGREGRIYFGFFVSKAVNEITFTLTGTGECDGTIAFEEIGVTNTSYKVVTTKFATVINLVGEAAVPEVTDPVTDAPVTDAPVTDAPVTDAPVTDAPVTDDAVVTDGTLVTDDTSATGNTPVTDAPVTDAPVTDAPVTDGEQSGTETEAPVTTLEQSGVETQTRVTAAEQTPVTTSADSNSDKTEVPTTGDMNAPMLQISCAVIAVIAASALIYIITHKSKIKKGE